ncbi:MAG: hypothetical protein KGI54_16335 [Pseudomonadota bacterium]|nr:hypothetical protein [Pseudomonadota bacterium]
MEPTTPFITPKQNTSKRPEKKIKTLRVRMAEDEQFLPLFRLAKDRGLTVSEIVRSLIAREIQTCSQQQSTIQK